LDKLETGPGYFWKQDDTGAGFAVENFLVIYCEMMDTILKRVKGRGVLI